MLDDSVTKLSITLIVMTYNEATHIARCLDSVPFADEKIVIDCGSTDNTVKIAEAHGAKVIFQEWLGFGPQRNFASKQAKNDWIIVLDADEHLSEKLIQECNNKLPDILKKNTLAGVILRRNTQYMGKPMRWYKPMIGEKIERLYHRERANWTNSRVHESLQFSGQSTEFKSPVYHINNPTLIHKQLKILLYSELKARDWNDKNKSIRMWQTPFVFLASFLKDYIIRRAFLDGWRGFIVAYIAANYAVYKRIRYYEMNINPTSIKEAKSQLIKHQIER